MEIANKSVYVFTNWGILPDAPVSVSLACCVTKTLNTVESVPNSFLHSDLRLGFLSFALMFLNVTRSLRCVTMSVKKMFSNDSLSHRERTSHCVQNFRSRRACVLPLVSPFADP